MKKLIITLAALFSLLLPVSTNAFNIKDLLNAGKTVLGGSNNSNNTNTNPNTNNNTNTQTPSQNTTPSQNSGNTGGGLLDAAGSALGGLFGGNGNNGGGILGAAGSALGGLVEGVFTQSDITVAQMAGTWTATGSAVSFQSDNFLKKAGGAAVAGTIESKLNPYYQQYGLTGSTLVIQANGSFQLKVKGVTLKGTITKLQDGNFQFSFTPFGNFSVGSLKTYVQKTPTGLDIMFDATKLKNLLSTVAGFTGNSLATTAAGLLDSYEGLCVGFAYKNQ